MGKYYLSESFNVVAGANFGVLMSAKSGDESETEFYNTLNAALGLGLGYELASGLSFSTRYNIGLSNLIKDAEDDYKQTLGTFQLSIGYKL